MISSTSQAFFDQKYREDADPWKFATSGYELGRYGAIVAALGNRRFHYAVEPGCSIGVLTSQLAKICDVITAFDLSPTAAEAARVRCAPFPHVAISCQSFRSCYPRGADLFLLSEIGYYFSDAELTHIMNRCVDELARSATVVACHWLGHSLDHILSGDEVHGIISRTAGLSHELGERHGHFRIDRWRKTGVQR
jgi:hypothetical protein